MVIVIWLFRYWIISFKEETGIISSSLIIEASEALDFGKITFLIPKRLASMQIGRTPFIFSIEPSKESSPIKIVSFKFSLEIILFAIKIPIAIGKSKIEPSFLC